MEFIGFSEETIKWFKSYLSNRKFKVRIKNTFSEPGNLLCGVPQRSILGPVLFLLYVNDMPQAVDCELFRSSRQEVFCKKGLLRNFAKLQAAPETLLKKRLWHRCFPVNFAKFLRTPFLAEHLRWLLLNYCYMLRTLAL